MTIPEAAAAYELARIRVLAAGATLATIVSHSAAAKTDPAVVRALEIHQSAVAERDSAYETLMEGVAIRAAVDTSIAAVHAEPAEVTP